MAEFEVTQEDTIDTRESSPEIVSLSDGRVLVAWTQFSTETSRKSGIRVLEADGTPVTDEFFPAGLVAGPDTLSPQIAAIDDNTFVLVDGAFFFNDLGGGNFEFGTDVNVRIITLSGTTLTSSAPITILPAGTTSTGSFDVEVTSDGNIVVAFTQTSDLVGNSNPSVNAVILDRSGSVLTSSTQISERDTSSPSRVTVNTDEDGTAVITWTQNNVGNTNVPLLGQTIEISLAGAIQPFTRIDHTLRDNGEFGIGLQDTVILANGDVLVLSVGGPDPEVGAIGDSDRLFGTIFNSDLTVTKVATFRIDQVDSANGIAGAEAVAFEGGGFVVSFSRKPTTASSGFDGEIYYRVYDNTYAPTGGEIRLTNNDTENGNLNGIQDFSPTIARTSGDGDVTFVWVRDIFEDDFDPFGDEENLWGTQVIDLDPNPPAPPAAPSLVTNTGIALAEGSFEVIDTTELLTTDADTADSALTYTLTSAPTNGVLFVDTDGNRVAAAGEIVALNGTFTQADIANNRLVYAHDGGETTGDSLQFTVSDGTSSVGPAAITITVTAVDDAAVPQPDAFVVIEPNTLTGDLFADNGSGSDTDVDSALAVTAVNGVAANVGQSVDLAVGGSVTVQSDGTFSFDPGADFLSLDDGESASSTFTYSLNGVATNVTIRIDGTGSTQSGTAGNSSLVGNSGSDILTGMGGNDYLTGRGGVDMLSGGDGNDRIFGGDDNDILDGGPGADRLYGQNGDDTVAGGAGNDFIHGGDGDDDLSGGDDDDTIYGGAGADTVNGDSGADYLHGGSGDDTIDGGLGNDTIYGFAGADTIDGGAGDDFAQGGDDADTVRGGDGNDQVRGGAGDDTVSGEAGDDAVFGDAGNDTLTGGAGSDTLRGGAGDDLLSGGTETDRFDFEDGWGNDTISDFANDGLEKINLFSVTGVSGLADLTITDVAGGALIQFGGSSILVEGLLASDLDAGDFIFGP